MSTLKTMKVFASKENIEILPNPLDYDVIVKANNPSVSSYVEVKDNRERSGHY